MSKIEFKNPFSKERWEICKQCGLLMDDEKRGFVCNDSLWLNPETNEVSLIKLKNLIQGCGCMLNIKINNEKSKCPANKW